QHAAADIEEQMVLAAFVADVAFGFREQLAEFEQRLLRKNDFDLFALFDRLVGAFALHRHERQPVPIGGHQAHRIRPQHEERAVEKEPRVFAGNRKLRLADHLAQRFARQRRTRGTGRFRQRRKIFTRQRLHPRVEFVGGDLHAVLDFLDSNVGFGKRLDDLVKLLRRERERAALRNRRVAAAAQRDLEIGRQHADLVALRFDQHVRENRDRVLALDAALEKLQFSQKLVLTDDEFHMRAVTSKRRGSRRRKGASQSGSYTLNQRIRRDKEVYRKRGPVQRTNRDD